MGRVGGWSGHSEDYEIQAVSVKNREKLKFAGEFDAGSVLERGVQGSQTIISNNPH